MTNRVAIAYHILFNHYHHKNRMTRCQFCGFHHEFSLCLGLREFLLTKKHYDSRRVSKFKTEQEFFPIVKDLP